MIGTKRRSVSLNSNADDNPFQSKKAIAESSLSGQAASISPSSEVETAATPPLDRRKAARQHVKALNTEFASWVQAQLRDHPDELWEDGVRDYQTQASDILEKFTDVVNWLRAKSGSEGSMSIRGTQSIEKKNEPQTNSKELKSVPVTSMFGMPSTNAGLIPSSTSGASSTQASFFSSTASSAPSWSFGLSASTQALSQGANTAPATSWSSGVSFDTKSLSSVKTFSFSNSPKFGVSSNNQAVSAASTASFMSSTSSGIFSNSQTTSFGPLKTDSQPSFMFGNQKSTALNDSTKEDADEDNEPEQPSSPSVKRSEEKGIAVVHETKCKLYMKSTDPADKEPWKDKGAGKLFIKCEEGAAKGTKESKPRILVRNDVGKIMLNASLYPGIKTNLQKNAIVSILHTVDDNEGSGKAVARTFLIRVKNEEERNRLADTIREHAPAT